MLLFNAVPDTVEVVEIHLSGFTDLEQGSVVDFSPVDSALSRKPALREVVLTTAAEYATNGETTPFLKAHFPQLDGGGRIRVRSRGLGMTGPSSWLHTLSRRFIGGRALQYHEM